MREFRAEEYQEGYKGDELLSRADLILEPLKEAYDHYTSLGAPSADLERRYTECLNLLNGAKKFSLDKSSSFFPKDRFEQFATQAKGLTEEMNKGHDYAYKA